jgi:hypothetical protein
MSDKQLGEAAWNDLTALRVIDPLLYRAIRDLMRGSVPAGDVVVVTDDDVANITWDDDDEPAVVLQQLEPCDVIEGDQVAPLGRLRVNLQIVYYRPPKRSDEAPTLEDCLIIWVKRYDVPVCA